MSTAAPEAHSDRLSVRPVDRMRSAPLSSRLHRTLFSTHRWPWALVDAVIVAAFYEIGIRVSPYGGYSELVSPYVALSVVFAASFVAISLGLGSYDRERRFARFVVLRTVVLAALLASLLSIAFYYFTLYEVVGRLTLVFGATFATAGVLAYRFLVASLVRRHPYRVTVVGDSQAVADVLRRWSTVGDQDFMNVLVPWTSAFGDPSRPTVNELVAADVAEIVVTNAALTEEEAITVALVALKANVPVTDERRFYGRLFERLPLDDISKRWILEQGLTRPQGVVVATKRLMDIALASLGLIVFTPFMALIWVAVRLSSPGPALFVQPRQGRFYQPFRMLKFRTMVHEPTGMYDQAFTSSDDPRVTGVGRFLRRAHLDELPQLINILRGDMSVVGPRPEALDFAERMDAELPLYELRYLVRPGLTGHAQLKQGYAMDTVLDTRTKLSYDLFYLCNYSMRLDVQIILRTVFFLIRGSR